MRRGCEVFRMKFEVSVVKKEGRKEVSQQCICTCAVRKERI